MAQYFDMRIVTTAARYSTASIWSAQSWKNTSSGFAPALRSYTRVQIAEYAIEEERQRQHHRLAVLRLKRVERIADDPRACRDGNQLIEKLHAVTGEHGPSSSPPCPQAPATPRAA